MSGGIFDFLLFSAFLLSACPSEKHSRACGVFLGVRVRELLMKVMTKVRMDLVRVYVVYRWIGGCWRGSSVCRRSGTRGNIVFELSVLVVPSD